MGYYKEKRLWLANYKCELCGKGKYDDGGGLNAHHLLSLREGGSSGFENLICVCDECHSILHPKNKNIEHKYEDWLANTNKLDTNLTTYFYPEFDKSVSNKKIISNEDEIDEDQGFHLYEDNI